MKIILQEIKVTDEIVWQCSSNEHDYTIGRTPEEALNHWKNQKWMKDNPEKVNEIFDKMFEELKTSIN